ncbi:MAG: hypothetical protein GWN13_02015, partial [Phycisphaerae bacterium]|nr:hypothetical protein [Phycisphaerae bacterium]
MTLFDIRDGSGTLITISRSLGSISAQLNNGTKGIFLDPSPANDIWDGNWHHVGLTVNKSSDAVGLWVDGNLEADDQSSYNASWRSTAGSLNGHDMVFGRSSTGTSKSPGRYTGMSVFSTAYSSFNMNQLAAGV